MQKFSKKLIGITLSSVLFVSSVFSMNVNNVNAASKIKINKTKAEVYVGKTVQLKVTGTKNKITWTSNNKKIATVTTKGKVKGIKKGTTTITAKVSKKKLTCKVTVKEKDVVKPTNTPNIETVPTETPIVTQTPIVTPTIVPTITVDPTIEPTVTPTSTPVATPIFTPTDNMVVTTEKPHIKYAGNYKVQFNEIKDVYQVLFSLFLEDKETAVKSSGIANIEIINSNQENIYNQSIKFAESDFDIWGNAFSENLKCCVEIPVSSIIKSKSDNGVLSLDIKLDSGEYFERKTLTINNLPLQDLKEVCRISLPDTPVTVSDTLASGGFFSTVCITDVNYKVEKNNDKYKVTINVSGEKTYDKYGLNSNFNCNIGWKLYSGNTVIDSGTLLTPHIITGEKFENAHIYIYNIEEGDYRFEFFNK